LAVRLGGRAAELVAFGRGLHRGASDLASATDLATKMVREYGLSPDVGPVGYPAGGPLFLGHGALPAQNRSYSEATQHMIDREVARLLREAEERASTLLDEHRAELDRLTELLLEQETVDGAAVYDLVGRPMPGGSPLVLTASPDGRDTADVG
jgi:cell division protease FtsH